jgi:hypothetical protein
VAQATVEAVVSWQNRLIGQFRLDNDHDCPSPDALARARSLLVSALERMEISSHQRLAAGLPLPDPAPTKVL